MSVRPKNVIFADLPLEFSGGRSPDISIGGSNFVVVAFEGVSVEELV